MNQNGRSQNFHHHTNFKIRRRGISFISVLENANVKVSTIAGQTVQDTHHNTHNIELFV